MPRITAQKMRANHTVSTDWCPGCGLHHHTTGEHRGDCTAGHHGHHMSEPCTDRCVINTVDNPCAQHAGPDTPGGPNP